SRFDDRVTGRLNAFSPGSKKIHIDIDPSSINKNVRVDVPLIGDCAEVLGALIAGWRKGGPRSDGAARKAWWRQIDQWRGRDCLRYGRAEQGMRPMECSVDGWYGSARERGV